MVVRQRMNQESIYLPEQRLAVQRCERGNYLQDDYIPCLAVECFSS
jgi:hypothetical protein